MAHNDCKPLPELSEKDIKRFQSYVDKTPGQGPNGKCWTWTGERSKGGYGRFGYYQSNGVAGKKGKTIHLQAHRVAYFLKTGIDPYPLCALHVCDYPPCCNPDDITPGTHAQNQADKKAKGRAASGDRNASRLYPERRPRGAGHYRARLSEADVMVIRKLYADGGVTQQSLADRFKVTLSNVHCIIHRKIWKCLP